ncbi:hypothetical protein CURE108131_04365 [Cupriavidus respiraculi]|uniref:SGNH hydrolase-type esterase domain-containing protein n=1 Tax=Cupriavidus respiraculi TaxID=195930 RepID=A0ABM8WJ89_9BURK|nr:hypothetical protein [Cupriavidus respiraculi]CAG9167422.1 hypothetical protein LMG21510_00745 [Cupriavidus respiraculi]
MNTPRKLVGVAVLVCLIGAATAEVFARAALGLGHPPLYQSDSEIEYLLKPDQNVRRFGNHYRVNHFSMRAEDFAPTRAPDERRVLVFGDSVVNAGAQVDQYVIATELLHRELAELEAQQPGQGPAPNDGQPHKKTVTVGNVSAFSWGPGNWLAYAKRYGFFEADTVIIVTNSGDYGDVPTFEPLNPNTHPSTEPPSAVWEAAVRYLPVYLQRLNPSPPPPPPPAVTSAEAGPDSLRDLKALIRMAQQAGARVRLVQHYQTDELDGDKPPLGTALFAQACEELGVPVLSMQQAEREARQTAYMDNIHLTAQGQRILADTLMLAARQ